MQKFGCPKRSTPRVRQLQDGVMARFTDSGAIPEAFTVTSGVMQGCVPATTLFTPTFSAMLLDAYRDKHPGIRIAYRTDGHLLNSRRMRAPTRLSMSIVHDLLFTDDCALNSTTEVYMQLSMDLFAAGCANYGLAINMDITGVMHQPSPNTQHYTPPETATAKADREARKSQLPPPRNTNAQLPQHANAITKRSAHKSVS
ncbi:hypothetical protein SprV_0401597100 [Sparganum proliferum]